MKKIIIILSLSFVLNICKSTIYASTTQEINIDPNLDTNAKSQQIERTDFQELLDAIDKFEISKIYNLINRLQLSQNQKYMVLKKIDDLISSKRLKYLVKLIAGLPLLCLGSHFFYVCFNQRKLILQDNRDCNIGFEMGSFYDIFCDGLCKADFRWQHRTLDESNKMLRDGQKYNLPAILLAILSTYLGTKLTISGLKNVCARDISKLKNIKQIILEKII